MDTCNSVTDHQTSSQDMQRTKAKDKYLLQSHRWINQMLQWTKYYNFSL